MSTYEDFALKDVADFADGIDIDMLSTVRDGERRITAFARALDVDGGDIVTAFKERVHQDDAVDLDDIDDEDDGEGEGDDITDFVDIDNEDDATEW